MSGFKPRKHGVRDKLKSRDALRQENRQVHAVAKEYGLDKDEQRELHDEVTGRALSYQELRLTAQQRFGSPKKHGKKPTQ